LGLQQKKEYHIGFAKQKGNGKTNPEGKVKDPSIIVKKRGGGGIKTDYFVGLGTGKGEARYLCPQSVNGGGGIRKKGKLVQLPKGTEAIERNANFMEGLGSGGGNRCRSYVRVLRGVKQMKGVAEKRSQERWGGAWGGVNQEQKT